MQDSSNQTQENTSHNTQTQEQSNRVQEDSTQESYAQESHTIEIAEATQTHANPPIDSNIYDYRGESAKASWQDSDKKDNIDSKGQQNTLNYDSTNERELRDMTPPIEGELEANTPQSVAIEAVHTEENEVTSRHSNVAHSIQNISQNDSFEAGESQAHLDNDESYIESHGSESNPQEDIPQEIRADSNDTSHTHNESQPYQQEAGQEAQRESQQEENVQQDIQPQDTQEFAQIFEQGEHIPHESVEEIEGVSAESLNTDNPEQQSTKDDSPNQSIDSLHKPKTHTKPSKNSDTLPELLHAHELQDPILFDTDEFPYKPQKRSHRFDYILYSKRLFVCIALIASFIGLYAGYLFFGSTSFEVLWSLHQTKNTLHAEVEQERLENAALQRRVLELKALEPK